MAFTTANLVTRCKTRFGDPSNRIIADAEWVNYLNDAYQEVNARSRDWPWHRQTVTINTAAGTNIYNVESTLGATNVDAVYNQTLDYRLRPEEGTSEYRDDYSATAETAPPQTYFMYDQGRLQLWPTPDAVYVIQVDANIAAADLASGSSDPKWPDQYRRALVEFALSRAYMDDGNTEYAKDHRDIGDAIVGDMRQALLGQPRNETYPHVVDDWWD